MSIETELKRLYNAKSSLRESIISKGVQVDAKALLDKYPGFVNVIETGEIEGIELLNRADFPETGSEDVIYIDEEKKIYKWSENEKNYLEMSSPYWEPIS